MTCTNIRESEIIRRRETQTVTLVQRIRIWDGFIGAIVIRSDKVVTSDNLESWSNPTSKLWMSVIDTGIDARMI
jgi:hypothetical protein